MMALVGIIVLALILTFVIMMYNQMNKINQETIKVTPNTVFCPLGESLDSSLVIEFDNAIEVYHKDYSLEDMMFSIFTSKSSTLELADNMYQMFQDSSRKGNVIKMDQILIPKNAAHIGSAEITPAYNNQVLFSDLKFDILNTNIQLYAWNTEYQLNSGRECSCIEMVIVLNEKLVYGKLQKLGKTEMVMTVVYGTK